MAEFAPSTSKAGLTAPDIVHAACSTAKSSCLLQQVNSDCVSDVTAVTQLDATPGLMEVDRHAKLPVCLPSCLGLCKACSVYTETALSAS